MQEFEGVLQGIGVKGHVQDGKSRSDVSQSPCVGTELVKRGKRASGDQQWSRD